MQVTRSRLATATLLILSAMLISSATSTRGPLQHPDKLLILSTSDVKGKTGPCG